MNERFKRVMRVGLVPVVAVAGLSACADNQIGTIPATRTPKPTFTPTSNETAIDELKFTTLKRPQTRTPKANFNPISTVTPENTRIPIATYTVTVGLTEVVINTPKPVSKPTFTPVPVETTQSLFPFTFLPERMEVDPNCGSVWLHGGVYDSQGNPINGVTVRLSFWGNDVFRITGEGGEDPGRFGFSPLDSSQFNSPQSFELTLVSSQDNPRQLSPGIKIDFKECAVAGQFDNITFQLNH